VQTMEEDGGIEPLRVTAPRFSRPLAGHSAAPSDVSRRQNPRGKRTRRGSQSPQLGRVWVGVHFGSRGLGHKTATWFLNAAGAKDGMDVEPCILPVASDLGAQYLEGMRLGGSVRITARVPPRARRMVSRGTANAVSR
jgi:hypothetical protein